MTLNDAGADGFPCPEWMLAFLAAIEGELDRVMWNRDQREYDSPFRNTGNSFTCVTFRVAAYDWGWDSDGGAPQPPNFTWRDLVVRWYKALGRDTTLSRAISPDEGATMLDECLAAVRTLDTPAH